MAVPKYSKMYKSFLKALQDKQEHAYIDVKKIRLFPILI